VGAVKSCKAIDLKLGTRMVFGTAECVSEHGKLLTHHTLTYVAPTVERAG
jgi:hypothetical protein